jgi:hypothetical protein
MKLPTRVTICEAGTRDGFQIEPEFIPTEQKIEVVDLDALIETSKSVQEIVGRILPGQIVTAGKWTRRYPLPDGVRERLPARS